VTRFTVGTAGHVDHGKTRLVQALTGTDTDRLPEERERGISIALGYAQLELPGDVRISLIDVPGHERFVRTMVAGATGIDLFLLVVDAAEGPRPQTYEHLEILRLLGVDRGVVAVTKIDAADPDRLRATLESAAALLPGHDVVPVSAVSGEGLPALREALARCVGAAGRPRRPGATRLYVDRAFSLPGVGPIVTGTLWSGSISPGDRLEVQPGGFEVRVRSVEVHGATVERAEPGQRVALATASERRRPLPRGAALVEPGAYLPSFRLDIVLEAAGELADGASVTVCHGTSAVPARVVRVGDRFAQLRLTAPLVAARDDRLVLRRQTTLGGGRILDPNPPRRPDEGRLTLLESTELRSILSALVQAPARIESLRARANLSDPDLAENLAGFVRAAGWVCSEAWLAATRRHAHALLEARDGEPDPGLPAAALLGGEPWAAAIEPLLGLERESGKLYRPGRRPGVGDTGELELRLAESGLEPLAIEDAELALQLEREGRLIRLGDGFAIGPDAYRRARDALVDECGQAGTISLARFRDRLGVSRRVAQLLLERFDVDRLTLRIGDERRLRRAASRR
jgi:selenocysteine-specific elongation factor